MERTRIWIKDGIERKNIKFSVGQQVLCFRRKKSGYPKSLEDGVRYRIKEIINDSLVLTHSENPYNQKDFKVHRTYLIPIEVVRDEIINELLKD